ncbi:hypothetical protein AOXY_G6183 [Acipenser oxyrinchus oxyrinchus]|uniref:Uncharacterized protein n=1 Tax=Acipenser oxyrinchus oxyrinchus TaxID=40147 RepID=A0AAD8LM39_ACIOX|nr:hypothetical protein AOXY_G6183 [Acipenser oxyrinchus oxyrinchus]
MAPVIEAGFKYSAAGSTGLSQQPLVLVSFMVLMVLIVMLFYCSSCGWQSFQFCDDREDVERGASKLIKVTKLENLDFVVVRCNPEGGEILKDEKGKPHLENTTQVSTLSSRVEEERNPNGVTSSLDTDKAMLGVSHPKKCSSSVKTDDMQFPKGLHTGDINSEPLKNPPEIFKSPQQKEPFYETVTEVERLLRNSSVKKLEGPGVILVMQNLSMHEPSFLPSLLATQPGDRETGPIPENKHKNSDILADTLDPALENIKFQQIEGHIYETANDVKEASSQSLHSSLTLSYRHSDASLQPDSSCLWVNDESEDPTYQTVEELETECSSPTLLETLQPEPDSTGANQHKLVLTTDAVLEEIFEEGEVLAKLNAVYARVSRKSKALSTAEEVHLESSNQEPHNDDLPPPPLPEKRFGIDQSSESKILGKEVTIENQTTSQPETVSPQ